MEKSNKIKWAIFLVLVALFAYNSLVTDRNWLGKPYLETTNDDGFALVELFTSEGCSSCPPADELVAEIRKKSAGKKIYFLAYHVDYWDQLGWKDSFSSAAFTERQYQYQDWLDLSVMYTPQFVVNGTAEFAGDEERTLYSLISDALHAKPVSRIRLTVREENTSLDISYKASGYTKNSRLLIAAVQKDSTTNVMRGENGGHSLNHAQIVRELHSIPLDETTGNLSIAMPEGFNTTGWEWIGFLQNNANGQITAAAKIQFTNPLKNKSL